MNEGAWEEKEPGWWISAVGAIFGERRGWFFYPNAGDSNFMSIPRASREKRLGPFQTVNEAKRAVEFSSGMRAAQQAQEETLEGKWDE